MNKSCWTRDRAGPNPIRQKIHQVITGQTYVVDQQETNPQPVISHVAGALPQNLVDTEVLPAPLIPDPPAPYTAIPPSPFPAKLLPLKQLFNKNLPPSKPTPQTPLKTPTFNSKDVDVSVAAPTHLP